MVMPGNDFGVSAAIAIWNLATLSQGAACLRIAGSSWSGRQTVIGRIAMERGKVRDLAWRSRCSNHNPLHSSGGALNTDHFRILR